jgi:hypothetical protein
MMIRFKSGKLLVVSPATSSIPVPPNKQVIQVTNVNRIFPAIHESQPGGIMLDYDFLGDQTEPILRRIAANQFYQKIKIYCYKSREHTKVDALLKTLGVQYFIYSEETKQPSKTVQALNEILEATVVGKLAADGGY